MSSKATIMIPTYNQSQYIKQCVESAMKQDYPNLEIVISDDSTGDETEKIIKNKYIRDSRIKYFRNENRLGRVRNYQHTLYEKVTGDYVLNLDGDDWLIDNTYISNAVKLLDENNDIVCTMAHINVFNAQNDEFTVRSEIDGNYSIFLGTDFLMLNAKKKLPFNHMTNLYRRQLALKIGFYNTETVWSDAQSLFRLIYLGKIVLFNKYVGTWRIHEKNESKAFFNNTPVNKLFFSEETIANFMYKNNTGVLFDIKYWLYLWKYEYVKEYIIYFLKNKNFKKIKSIIIFLIRHDTKFFMKTTISLIKDISLRTFKYINRNIFLS